MRSSPKHVLVTGGAGFIGSHLVDLLVADGHRVSVLDDLSRGRRAWVSEGADLYEVDVRDRGAVADVVVGLDVDAVAHLAALHFIPAVNDAPRLAHEINVLGTENVLAARAKRPPSLLLFASTAAVYPNLHEPLRETTPPGPIDLYGRTKLKGERMVERFAGITGTSAVSARLFNVMGPRETNPHVVPEIIGQLQAGVEELELGNLEPHRDLTDVRDVADALRLLLVEAPPGYSVYNVGSGRALSVIELVRECAVILDRRIPVRQVPERMREVERNVLVADISAIVARTGWRPVRELRETLAELLLEQPIRPNGVGAHGQG